MHQFSLNRRRQTSPQRRAHIRRVTISFIILSLVLVGLEVGRANTPQAHAASGSPAQYVNPFIGTGHDIGMTGQEPHNGGVGQVSPAEHVPFGMISWGPQTFGFGLTGKPATDYNYTDSQIQGFPVFNNSYSGGYTSFLPFAGAISASPGTNPGTYYSSFSHANEQASAGYYQVTTNSGVTTALTGTTRSGDGHFTYPVGQTATLLIAPDSGATNSQGSVAIDSSTNTISGVDSNNCYFYAQFDHSFTGQGVWSGNTVTTGGTSVSGAQVGGYVTFALTSNQTVEVHVGLSYVSVANAQQNLAVEIPSGTSFATVQANALDAWNTKLSRVTVNDPNAQLDDLTTFYSALYRSLFAPTITSDYNRQYRGWDTAKTTETVASGHWEYAVFSLWDQAHAGGQYQLLALLFPNEASDMAQSYLDASAQSGGIEVGDVFPGYSSYLSNIVDDSIPADFYSFGAHQFNTTQALNIAYQTATTSNKMRGNAEPFYLQHGYVPVDQQRASVEGTLSFARADFADAQFAQATGNQILYNQFAPRSDNWTNVFDPVTDSSPGYTGYTGYMWARQSDGSFAAFTNSADGSDSASTNSSGTRLGYFQEASTGQESWWVPQNLAGLIQAMGGTATFVNRLDSFFTKLNDGDASSYAYLGNEPDFPMPWIYDWAGAPSHAQSVVRRILTTLYANSPNGTPGNDDWSAMSTWYVWAGLGMYPEIPGIAGVALNSPLFAQVTITFENGHTLTINGNGASRTTPYVQSATLNGTAYNSPWLPLSAILNSSSANTLSFTLGSSASSWGANPSVNAPPSYPAPQVTYNNTGVSDDANPSAANYDGHGDSYSAQALQAVGVTVGGPVSYHSVNFTWPNVASGQPDNYSASSQALYVAPVAGAQTLAFLGSATNGASSGTATILYTDGTEQPFTLAFGDWYNPGSSGTFTVSGTSVIDGVVATTAYRNQAGGKQTLPFGLYYTDVGLLTGKTVASVALPSSVASGQLHVFAVGTGTQAPLN